MQFDFFYATFFYCTIVVVPFNFYRTHVPDCRMYIVQIVAFVDSGTDFSFASSKP